MQLLGHDPDELEIAITQMVDFARGGEEVKMSGRSGDFIALDDVIAEVGPDAARFTYLMQSVDSRQTFDLDEVAKQGMENPVFYVQYAHARICSIFAKAAEAGVERAALADVDVSLLVHERELDLLRSLQELPDMCGWRVSTTLCIASPRGAREHPPRCWLLPRLLCHE